MHTSSDLVQRPGWTSSCLDHGAAVFANGVGAYSVTDTVHISENVTLSPPVIPAMTGTLNQPVPGIAPATILHLFKDSYKRIDREGFLDNCRGALRNLTENFTQTKVTEGTDEWADDVKIGFDLRSGKYSIYVPAHGLPGEVTSTTTRTAFSKAPCNKPREPVPVQGNVVLNADVLDEHGAINPEDPYVISGPLMAPVVPGTKESWMLELKNPPSSGKP